MDGFGAVSSSQHMARWTISYYDVWWYALRQPWETQIHRKRVQGDTPAQAVTMVWARDVLARFLMDAQNLWDRLWAGEE